MNNDKNVVSLTEYRDINPVEKLVAATQQQITDLMALGTAEGTIQASKLVTTLLGLQKKLEAAHRKAQANALIDGLDIGAVADGVKDGIRAWLVENDYYYVHKTGCFWLYKKTTNKWMAVDKRNMVNEDHQFADADYMRLFIEVLKEDGRYHYEQTYSFAELDPAVLNMLRYDFCKVVESDSYHWLFDVLMTSLGGGKQENMTHIEKLVCRKYLHPEDYMVPALALYDVGGGSGKSLFVSRVLTTIFGKELVADNIGMSEITRQFNSHIIGRAIWFINESVEDRVDENRLKQVLHSPTVMSEEKGRTPFQAANTAWMIIAGNGEGGCIKLANSNTDRRFSVIKPTQAMKEWLAPVLTEKSGETCTPQQADMWMREVGQDILSDPIEVGKWLNHIVTEHGGKPVSALHGSDYNQLVSVQTPFHEQVYTAIFSDPMFTYVRRGVAYDLYADKCRQYNTKAFGNAKFYAKMETWANRVGISLTTERVKWIKNGSVSTADVITVLPGTKKLGCNDDQYVIEEYGKRTWLVDVI